MSEAPGQWSADPYRRAELRWHDGTAWTTHVSTGGVPGQAPTEHAEVPSTPPPAPNPYQPVPSYYAQPGYAQQVPAYYLPGGGEAPGIGRLVAAGVLSIITGVVTLLMGIYLLSLISSDVGGFLNDVSGGAGTFAVLVCVVIGAAFLWFGIAGVQKRSWSRIAMAVAAGLSELLVLLLLLGGSADASIIVPMAWFGTILGLAISFNPSVPTVRPGY
jgi:hypothetical protein